MAAQQQSVKITRPTGTASYGAGFVINNTSSTAMLNFQFSDNLSKFLLGGTLISSNSASLSSSMSLLLFNNSFSIQSDSASFNPSNSQLDGFLASINFVTWTGLASNKISEAPTSKPTVINSGNIYGVLISNATYVPISTETLTLKLDLENQ